MRTVWTLLLLLALAACSSETASTTAVPTTDAPATTDVPTTTLATPTTSTTTVPPTTTTTIATTTEVVVTVVEGEVDGPGRVDVPLDNTVILKVTSDVADAVHVHGYDLFFDIDANTEATLTFVADIPGIFEVELESSHLLLVELVVQ